MNTSINGTGIVGSGVCSLADQWSSILDSLGSPPPATSMFGGNGSNGGATFAAAVAANVANANSNGGGGGGIMDTIIAFLKTGRGKIVLAVVVAIAIAAMVVLYMYLKRRRLRREAEENLALEAALADEVAATLSRLPMQQLSRDTPIPVVAIANANANANASAMQFCQPPTPQPQPTPRPAQPPTPQPAAQPHRGAESESPRNVSGENEFRSFHKLHMSETGGKKQQSDTELPNMPPPDFGAPVSHVATAAAAAAARPVPPGEVAMPPRESHDDAGKLMPMPMPNNVGSVEPVGGPEPVSAAAVAAVALPTLAEDPNFTPLA